MLCCSKPAHKLIRSHEQDSTFFRVRLNDAKKAIAQNPSIRVEAMFGQIGAFHLSLIRVAGSSIVKLLLPSESSILLMTVGSSS